MRFVNIIAIIGIALLIWALFEWTVRKNAKKVRETSTLLMELDTINKQFCFHLDVEPRLVRRKALDSKAKYDRFDCGTLFDEVVEHDGILHKMKDKILENKKLFADYCCKTSRLVSSMTPETAKELHISYKTYCRIEGRLFNERLLKPVTEGVIVCNAYYISPQGRNSYSKSIEYSIFEVEERYRRICERRSRQNTEEARRRAERAKMSEKLRYEILRRDNFRCQICGRTQDDGVKLHVDHIIPVSRGGKTVPSNLRTLCDQCNRGKGATIE